MSTRSTFSQTPIEAEKLPKKRSFYFKTGIVAIGYGIFACIISLVFGDIGEFISFDWIDWFLPLVTIPAFIGNHISGGTYFGREADLIVQKPQRSYEKSGTALGILFGLTVGIGLAILGAGDFLSGGSLGGLVDIIDILFTILASVASFAGFGNRLGSAVQNSQGDRFFERLSSVIVNEKKPILIGAMVGLTFSLTTWLLGIAVFTGIAGISFLTGGLPLWIMGGLFVLSYTSSFASGFDYFGRAYSYIQATYNNDEKAQNEMAGKTYQYKGAAIGVAIGAVIAIGIIITLLVTQPYLFALVAAAGVFFVCTGTWGGICSRLGRILFDERTPIEKPKLEPAAIVEPKPIPEPAPIPVQVPIERKEKPSRHKTSTQNMLAVFAEQEEQEENIEFFTANKQRDDDSISALLNGNRNLSIINHCRFESTNTSEDNFAEGIALEA